MKNRRTKKSIPVQEIFDVHEHLTKEVCFRKVLFDVQIEVLEIQKRHLGTLEKYLYEKLNNAEESGTDDKNNKDMNKETESDSTADVIGCCPQEAPSTSRVDAKSSEMCIEYEMLKTLFTTNYKETIMFMAIDAIQMCQDQAKVEYDLKQQSSELGAENIDKQFEYEKDSLNKLKTGRLRLRSASPCDAHLRSKVYTCSHAVPEVKEDTTPARHLASIYKGRLDLLGAQVETCKSRTNMLEMHLKTLKAVFDIEMNYTLTEIKVVEKSIVKYKKNTENFLKSTRRHLIDWEYINKPFVVEDADDVVNMVKLKKRHLHCEFEVQLRESAFSESSE